MKTFGTLKSALAEIQRLNMLLSQRGQKIAQHKRLLAMQTNLFKKQYIKVQRQKLLMHCIYLAIIASLLFVIAGENV